MGQVTGFLLFGVPARALCLCADKLVSWTCRLGTHWLSCVGEMPGPGSYYEGSSPVRELPGFVSWLPSILFVSWVVYEQGPLSSYLKLLKGFRRLLNFTYKGSLLLRYFHIYNANWAGWQLLEMKHPVLSSVVPFVGLCFHFSFL